MDVSSSSTPDALDRLAALTERPEILRQVVFVAITLLGMIGGLVGNWSVHRRGWSGAVTAPRTCSVGGTVSKRASKRFESPR